MVFASWFMKKNDVKSQKIQNQSLAKSLYYVLEALTSIPLCTILFHPMFAKKFFKYEVLKLDIQIQKVMTYHSNEWVYLWCGRFLSNLWLDFCRIFSHWMYILLLLEEENRSKTQPTWYKVSSFLFCYYINSTCLVYRTLNVKMVDLSPWPLKVLTPYGAAGAGKCPLFIQIYKTCQCLRCNTHFRNEKSENAR